jgi:hypothetical protein
MCCSRNFRKVANFPKVFKEIITSKNYKAREMFPRAL